MRARCVDCGAQNPRLTEVEGVLICSHRAACEARQMLLRGESVEAAAAHAQKGKTDWKARALKAEDELSQRGRSEAS